MNRDVLRHALRFLSVAGLWNARLVCREWTGHVAACRVECRACRLCLGDMVGLPSSARLTVQHMTVHDSNDGGDGPAWSLSVQVSVRILTLEFASLRDSALTAFSKLLESASVTHELRLRFGTVNERCGMFGCGNLCKLLKNALEKFPHCFVELPWSFNGLFTTNWCLRKFYMHQVAWRLRGGPTDFNAGMQVPAVHTATRFFNRHDVRRFVLEDIDFGLSSNAQELARFQDAHVNLRYVDFVNCAFPPVAQWGLLLGALFPTLCQLYDVSFESCSVDERELRQAFPTVEFKVRMS